MPVKFIWETAVTIDHELNEMRVDTTVKSMATALKRSGFREVTREDSAPYRRFIGQADQLRFRKVKGQRSVGGAARQKMLSRTMDTVLAARKNHAHGVKAV